MTRTLVAWLWVWGLGFAAVGCGDGSPDPDATPLPVLVISQDDIVSEDGVLALESGRLEIRSVSLIGDESKVQLIGGTTLDLGERSQEVGLSSPIVRGSYVGLFIELAPPSDAEHMLDVQLDSVSGSQSVRAISTLSVMGELRFPEGSRTIREQSTIELVVSLQGMFFYLTPLTSSVDGVYEAGEDARGFLTMDLVGMFDLRVSP